MTLDDLRVFTAVVEAGSRGAAARASSGVPNQPWANICVVSSMSVICRC
jgi:hypothetical protein